MDPQPEVISWSQVIWVLAGVVATLAGSIATIARILYVRLLGENGLITRQIDRQIAFVDSVEKNVVEVTALQSQLLVAMQKLSENQLVAAQAQIKLSEGMSRIALGHPQAAESHINQAKEILEHRVEEMERDE